MSFIYRDYNKPRIAINNSKIMRKSLFEKVHPKTYVNGIEVFSTAWMYQSGAGVRSDKTFKRFLKSIGTSYKEMSEEIYSTEGLDKVENIYFKMDQTKLIFTPKTKADITTKLNADYLYDMAVPFINTSTVFYYSQGRSANTQVATLSLAADVTKYEFVVLGEVSDISGDGNFMLTSGGGIFITEAGVISTANKVDYTNPFRVDPIYTVRATHNNGTVTSHTITLIVKRDYVDVQITVGGQYTNTTNAFAPVASGVPNMMADLPLLRSEIESNAMHYLAGAYPASAYTKSTYDKNIYFGSRRLSMKVADISFNEDWGCDLDTLAVLDDGTVFECTIPVMSEVIELTPIYAQYVTGEGTADVQIFNMSYTYTKRYKVKAVAAETSVLIDNIDTIAQLVKPVPVSASLSMKGAWHRANLSSMDTTIKDAVKDLHTDYYYEDNAVFIRGFLRVDAFNAMTANEFHTVFTKCFTTGFTKKKTKWWKKALAVVIIIIAIVLIVLSFIFPPFGIATASMQAALWALALGMLFLSLAGMAYAKHVGDETGMKMIAGATQVVGITLAVVAICNGYADAMTAYEAIGAMSAASAAEVAAAGGAAAMDGFITSAMVDLGVAALTVGVGAASLAVNTFGMGGEKERQIVNAAAAVVGTFQQFNTTLAGFSSAAVGPVQNVTNFVNLAASGYKSYLLVNNVGTHTPSATVNEQAVPEDGVESVFLLETRTVSFDAIEALNDRMNTQYGVNATNGILQRQYA